MRQVWYFDDMANAFGSTAWEVLETCTTQLFDEEDYDLVSQRFEWACIQIPACDGDLVVRPGCGAMMGDQYAVQSFLCAYESPTNNSKLNHVYELGIADASFFNCWCPIAPDNLAGLCDLSLSKYADDLVKMALAPIGTGLLGAVNATQKSLQNFDATVEPLGFKQNHDKLVGVMVLSGDGVRKSIQQVSRQQLQVPFKAVLSTKSLGSIITHDCSAQPEIISRLNAAQRAYYRRARSWSTK